MKNGALYSAVAPRTPPGSFFWVTRQGLSKRGSYNGVQLELGFSLSVPYPASLRRAPWYVWCSVAAVTSAVIGTQWDISWHESIGRDTFWTPAHLAIHLCGVLAGISCGYLILSTTLRRDSELRGCSVRMWGFYGPLGAFIAAWGGVAMITSAPFDNWWHNAYGLDVKILSPPHMLLAAGVMAVHLGALILVLGQMNRAKGTLARKLRVLYLYVGGLMLLSLATVQLELTVRSYMHTAHFYLVVALSAPLLFAGISRGSGYRWAATAVACTYTLIMLGLVWILPLFPAEPKLGPVYQNVTHFVPPEFPLLLIVPALALDLFWQRTQWRGVTLALASSAIFLAVFALVQWPFADFLMSPAARNRIFGVGHFAYFVRPTSLYASYRYVAMEHGAALWQQVGLAALTAAAGAWLGIAWGDRMRRIRR